MNEKIIDFYNEYRDYILSFFVFVIFLLGLAFIFWYFSNEVNEVRNEMKRVPRIEKVIKKEKSKLVVDIKGEVKTPGVYYLDDGKRVIDVVKRAGGFTKDADARANNLSMKLFDEMVIIIYSRSEIEKFGDTLENRKNISEKCKTDIIVNNSCVDDKKTDNKALVNEKVSPSDSSSDKSSDEGASDNKVSINNASLAELMNLSGIGESKAKAIIEYRNKKKFETIEEIKEVSGIGDALFEKIKDSITV